MKSVIAFLFAFLLISATHSFANRHEFTESSKPNKKGGGNDGGMGGFFGPGGGFDVPGFGSGWGNGVGGGYGAGYGGPNGGYSKGGIIRSSVVCKEKGPCYKKKLTCPAKCFSSYHRSGKGYGGGGGGGGCTIDCKKKCTAYC
ncbi:glycine-rich protein [Abeliophyllum distichum]|uniref:Glycine-rich protein n=1 Tax=Abeliophyllum distichum TaxID=126358 RepID=A0ABD1UGM1_9LAMI